MAGSPAGGGDAAAGSIKPGATAVIFLQGRGRAGTSCPGAVAVCSTRSTGTHHSIMTTPTAPSMAQAGLSGLAPCSVNAGPASGATALGDAALVSGERARGEADGCAGLRTGVRFPGPDSGSRRNDEAMAMKCQQAQGAPVTRKGRLPERFRLRRGFRWAGTSRQTAAGRWRQGGCHWEGGSFNWLLMADD